MKRNWSLRLRMLLAPMALIAVLLTVGGISFFSLNGVVSDFGRLANNSIPSLRNTGEMYLSYQRVRIALRTLGIPGLSKEMADKSIKEVHEAIASYEKYADAYVAQGHSAEEKAIYDKVAATWKDFKEVGGKALGLYASGKPEDKEKLIEIFLVECPIKANTFAEAMTELADLQKKHAEEWTGEAQETAASAKWQMVIAILLGASIGLAIALKMVSGIVRTISQVAATLAEGAEKVSGISVRVSEDSGLLSSSAAQQAAALQETTASVEETSAMVRKNAENAQRSASASEESLQNAEKGKKVVGEMISSIEGISASNQAIMQQIEASNKEMSDIVGVINEIGNKTKVINDIVFQTKLLSFNASVEAARAGEHGKGFAVVAEEVGNLAAMSGRSAKEITDLLETSTKRVQEIVANTQQKVENLIAKGTERVNSGIETARNCDLVLGEIVKAVESVGTMVSEIATASEEQSKGIGEINKAINELESAAQQNSTTSHSAAGSAEQLTQQVKGLRNTVGELTTLISGGMAGTAAAPVQSSARVIPMREAAKPVPGVFKRAAGSDYTPSANDPGFKEV